MPEAVDTNPAGLLLHLHLSMTQAIWQNEDDTRTSHIPMVPPKLESQAIYHGVR